MSHTGPVGVAVIGAGVISREYLTTLTALPDVRVHAVSDVREAAAAARASEFGIAAYGGVDVALQHPDVEIIVNLTIPAAHVEVGLNAIEAGKHLWSEKPLALDRSGASKLLEAAKTRGVRVGCAPDTILGPAMQAALRVVESGEIGRPLHAVFMMQTGGPEAWHPNPEFLYAAGAGPLFDMGPYYVTALVQALGPISSVAAIGSKSLAQRVIATGERAGTAFDVVAPTHVSVLFRFAGGASAQGILSFESPRSRMGFVEVTGTAATIAFPDPNRFDGEVSLWRSGHEPETTVVENNDIRRGLGVLDMARALRRGEPHRADGDLALHVLDVLCAIEEAIDADSYVPVQSRVQRALPLPAEWNAAVATL